MDSSKRILKILLTAGYMLALGFYAVLKGFVHRPPLLSDEHRRLARHLREKGYVLLENFYDDVEVEGLRQSLGKYMAEDIGDYDHINRVSYFRRPPDGSPWDGGVYRLWRADAIHPLIERFRRDSKIKGILEAAFRNRMICFTSIVQKNLPSGSTTRGFHIDIYAPREFKAFLFLSDVADESAGPYGLLCGSHRWRIKRYLNYLWRGLTNRNPVTDVSVSSKEMRRLEMFKVRKGSVVISCQQAIHRGLPLLSGDRWAVVNYYIEAMRPGVVDFPDDNRLGYRYSTQASV